MKKLILSSLCMLMGLTSMSAQTALQNEILEVAHRTNNYFMTKYSDPTLNTFVKKIRTSNLWTRAVYYEGLMALYEIDPQQRYLNYTDKWADYHKWTARGSVNDTDADNQCCQQTYMDRYVQTGGKKDLSKVKENLDHQMGTNRVNYWTWIDAIQMAMPAYAKYAKITSERKYLDYAMNSYKWSRDTLANGLFNKKEGLWWRDKDYVPPYKEKDGSNCYWSRGNGWVYAALVRVMETLPKTDKYYQYLKKDFISMSQAILKCQREDGYWNVSLVCPANYGGPEMTGTGLFLYGMAWGVQQGILPRATYQKAMDKAWKALAASVHEDGFIGYNQGTGKDPAAGQPATFTSVPDFEDYGTGCLLLGAAEYYKLLKVKSKKKIMKKYIWLMACLVAFSPLSANAAKKQKKAKKAQTELWPDGTKMDAWFSNAQKVNVDTLGKKYVLTDYGVKTDSTLIQTQAIQAVIDRAAKDGGGVIVVPAGTYQSGALFFKPKTHLYVSEGGKLKGSDRIANFPVVQTRIEGETCKYFSAFINADKCNGFTIAGPGTIDGNGYHYWEEFWIRRTWNRECTNKDAQRPRLVYISNSSNVTLQDVHIQNSPFWTNHIYRCDHVRFLGCTIFAPTSGMKAPSSDAIDIDVCHDVLVDGCYMSVNDDAIAIKGGKGTWADQAPENGPVYNVLIQNCNYGRVHGCLTLGSESVKDRNIVLRNTKVGNAQRVLWLKMRPDTPQHYEYITVDNIQGTTGSFLVIRPWKQFFKLGDRKDMPLSQCNNITMKNIQMDCDNFFDVGKSEKYRLVDFTFENINCTDKKMAFDASLIENTVKKKVNITPREKSNGLKTTGDADGLK